MTTQIRATLGIAVFAGFLAGCFTPTPVPNGPPVIIKQPISRVKEVGTHVDFSVQAENIGPPLTYQWCRNGSNIVGATEKIYCIEGLQMANVASYTCKVTAGTNGSVLSKPAHLSVFYTYCTNSVSGAMGVPIGLFSGGSVVIDGQTFDKVSATYGNFYGKNCTGQSGNFENHTFTKLTVDTYSTSNLLVNTGIEVSKLLTSWKWSNDNGVGAPTGMSLLSQTNLTLEPNKKYKVTVYYVSPLPSGQEHVWFNWLYHD